VPPRDSSNRLLDDCLFGPCLSECAHVHEIRPGEAAEIGEHLAQVMARRSTTLWEALRASWSGLKRLRYRGEVTSPAQLSQSAQYRQVRLE
jgi:hypothetical protein